MSDGASTPAPKPPLGLLTWIALYKLAKAVLSLAAALFVLHLLHKDLAKIALEWTEFLGMNPQGRFAARLAEHLAHLNPRRIHFITGVLLVYTGLYVTEGIGLFFEKRWAEWLTIAQTALLVPWEVYELARRPDWIKVLVLILNLLVIVYLLWRIRRDDRMEADMGSGNFKSEI